MQSLSLATDKVERILNILESQSKTIYDRSSLVAIQLPLTREPSVEVRARDGGEAIPPVVARIFSGDSTSPLTRDGHGCPKLNAQSFAGRKTNRAFIWQGCGAERGIVRFWKGWFGREGGGAFERVVGGGAVE